MPQMSGASTSPTGSRPQSSTRMRKSAASPLFKPGPNGPSFPTAVSVTVGDGHKKSIKAPSSRTGSALSMRNVFSHGPRPQPSHRDKEAASDSSGTDVGPKRSKPPPRFGFGLSKATAPVKAKKSLPPRHLPSPSTPVPSAKDKSKPHPSPLSRAPFVSTNNPPARRTPASIKSIASVFSYHNPSPGPLTDPAIGHAADASLKILELEGNPSQDMTGPGDVSFGSAAEVDEDEDACNVSALLSVDFGAPTPAHPSILFTRTNAVQDDNGDDDDDDDIDDDHDDDPTIQLQLETPSRPQRRTKARRVGAAGGLPTRQNLGYLSAAPPTPESFTFFPSRRPRLSSSMGRSRKVSGISAVGEPSRSRRTSQARPSIRDRGSVMSWEAVIERSKEFSEEDINELGMISGIGLGGLGAMSPGFGTPMYQRLSFGGTTDREHSNSRRHSLRDPHRDDGRLHGLGEIIAVQGSEIGSESGSGFLPPPQTPSPIGNQAQLPIGRPIPSLSLSPASSAGVRSTPGRGRAPQQPTIDALRRQLDAQAVQLRQIQDQLDISRSVVEAKDKEVVFLKASENALRTETLSFASERTEWLKQKREWQGQEDEWGRLAKNRQENDEHRLRLAAESELKWRWGSLGAELGGTLDRIRSDRQVLQVLLTELDLSIVSCTGRA